MSSDTREPIATPRFAALAALVLVPLYLWAGLGNRDVWSPDEPRFALVAREMHERGNYALPTCNGETYAHKPPLLFWSMNAASAVTGRDPSDGLTARIPSVIAGVGTLLVTGLLGAALFGASAGWLAALVLATMHLFCWEAHTAQMDALMTFWTTLAILCLVHHRAGRGAAWAFGFHLACGLGTLSKGPPCFLIAWAAALLWPRDPDSAWTRRELFRPRYLAAFLLPVLAWLGAAASYGGIEYVQTLLGKHALQRYVSSWHHERPWHYFLYTTPLEMLPWSLLLPAVIAFVRTRRDRSVQLAGVWILFMLLFFSFPKGKRGVYMLPAFPAAALLIAAMLESAAGRVRVAATAGFVLVPAIPIAFLVKLAPGTFNGVALDFTAMRACAVLALALLAYGLWQRTIAAMARTTVLATALLFLGLYASVLGLVNPQKSARAFCQEAHSVRRPGERFAYFGDLLEQYPLFLRETVLTAEMADEFVAQIASETSVLTFLQVENLKYLKERADLAVEVLQKRHLGDKDIVLARVSPRTFTAGAPRTPWGTAKRP